MNPTMQLVLTLLSVQCLLGGFDNLWHHELKADLPHEPGARRELSLHALRELVYAIVLGGVAWACWQGAWTLMLAALLATEIVITLCDFVVEDRTRKLAPTERVLHAVLALNYGALLAVWTPELLRWSHAPTALAAADYGAWSWAMTLFAAGAFGWAVRNVYAVARLGVPQWQREPMWAGTAEAPRTLLLTGATGFIGRALTRKLVERGDRVLVLSRNVARACDRFGPLVEVFANPREIDAGRHIDAIINLAGEPLAGGLWTQARKQKFVESRRSVTREVLALIARLEHKPAVLVNASAVGYYGDRADEVLDENSNSRACFMSDLCWLWEEVALQAARHGVRVCRLRIGLVLGAGGGVLQPMALAARLGGGAVLGDGRQWMSWIHLHDLLRLIEELLARPDLDGAINAVAPNPVTQREFMRALGRALHRPVLLRMPAAMLRALAGEMADLFLISQRVAPRRALDAGFRFDFPHLDAALADVLHHPPAAAPAAVVFANQECPVCRAEMNRYRRNSEQAGVALWFESVGAAGPGLPGSGLSEKDLQRRLFVQCGDGRLRSGIDGFIAIWRTLPQLRWLARVVSLPGVHVTCAMLYDLVCAPLLTRWNEQRLRRIGAKACGPVRL